MKLLLLLAVGVSFAPRFVAAQDLAASIKAMAAAYAGSGSIIALDAHTIQIDPRMPAPICAMPTDENGKTTWLYYAFPLASITVPLDTVDEKLIGVDTVFTAPDAAETYKPGEAGDTTMIVVAGLPGKEFRTLKYDREKFLHLAPGPHSASDYDQAPDNTEAFGLTFSSREAARNFAAALKNAVILARAQLAQQEVRTGAGE